MNINYTPIVILTSKKLKEKERLQTQEEHEQLKTTSNSAFLKDKEELRNIYPKKDVAISQGTQSSMRSMSAQFNYSPSKSISPAKHNSKIMSMNQVTRFRISRRNKDYINIDGSVISSKSHYSSMKNTRKRLAKKKGMVKNLSCHNPLRYFHNYKLSKTRYGDDSDYPNDFNETRLFNFSTLKYDSKRKSQLKRKLSSKNKSVFNYSARRQSTYRKRESFSAAKNETNHTQDSHSMTVSPLIKNINNSSTIGPKTRHRIKVKFPTSNRLTQEDSSVSIRESQEVNASAESLLKNKNNEPRVEDSIQDSDYVDLKHRYNTFEDKRSSKNTAPQQKIMDIIVPFCSAKVTLKKRCTSSPNADDPPPSSTKAPSNTVVVRKSMLDPRCKLKKKLIPHSHSKSPYSSLRGHITKKARNLAHSAYKLQESQNKDLFKILQWKRLT
ncbi:unnamed protein product [Moneuplotes crassus]|uniref:Uncharacterized protein n=1 Tax=Euplotes crassus TaxID=5936 RepID=A0AAD1UHE8_EUPCR|nr:unnamed protein product [Moneuplotes crassus]